MKTSPADATSGTATDAAAVPRRRGKSKQKNFTYEGEKAVIRLELDVTDAGMRGRVENHYEAAFRLRRALQREAKVRCRAYWAEAKGRAQSPKAVRERLCLSRKSIEALAKKHVEASKWMRHHLSKATALHSPMRFAPYGWDPHCR